MLKFASNEIFNFALLFMSLPMSSFAQTTTQIPNFRTVNAKFYRGGRPTQSGLSDLASLGVKTVINLQGGDLDSVFGPLAGFAEQGEWPEAIREEGDEVRALKMNYRSYPLDSVDAVTVAESLEIKKILADIRNPELQPVFIHCQHGNDRTGLIVALERVDDEGMSREDAYHEWVSLGHSALSQLLTGALDEYFAQVTAQY